MKAIIAGMLIALAALIYLSVSPLSVIVGSMLFSLGLLTILMYKFDLFTGKAGKLCTGEISGIKLVKIWIGNFVGVAVFSLLARQYMSIATAQKATQVAMTRMNADPANLIVGGIFCGMLMYIATAVNTPQWMTIMCVMAFICAGFYHCVADMAYFCLAQQIELKSRWSIVFVTIGNAIGCNIIPVVRKYTKSS